jgi:broad specificity phosphatase PhoE
MTSEIHLIRHAESVHNVSKDFSELDPCLTPLGLQQATQLTQTFPYAPHVGIILSSPLRRAIQTTLAAFPHVLDKRYFDPESGHGIESGATLILDPDLQERSALPCDTGSTRQDLEAAFPRLDVKHLAEGWQVKEGLYAPEDEAVSERAKRVRSRVAELSDHLKNQGRKHIVIVTHGVFMKFLSGDEDIDLPKAGWMSYTLEKHRSGIVLREIETD